MTDLDSQIDAAIAGLAASHTPLDVKSYIEAFRESAIEKAKDVLKHLEDNQHFAKKKPIFVSIGGGDGEELDFLLRNSTATDGILIELNDNLAACARRRTFPNGKSLHVVGKAAQDGLSDAMAKAEQMVTGGHAEAIVVTGHAVLHELYDRGLRNAGFDVVGFFGSIFSAADIPTFFTYREPGAPEKWPEHVTLSANCSAQSLLTLARAITQRHSALADLTPQPAILGDGIRMNKNLAMEVLAKLFYLKDLRHEIEERVTVIEHGNLQNALWTAIGDLARAEDRTGITSHSAPTKSFAERWNVLKVHANGIQPNNSSRPLATAESQTRVVAWRMPKKTSVSIVNTMPSDVALAQEAWENRDNSLLQSLLFSRGRAWVEAAETSRGVVLLKEIADQTPPKGLESLWSRYLVLIQRLFGGDFSGLAFFERGPELTHAGLRTLFRAEQMEHLRRLRKHEESLGIANELAALLKGVGSASSDLDFYSFGTSNLLLSNFLRFGGRYEDALHFIQLAETILKPGILSHATELSHCFYAKQVCIAMTGLAGFSSFGEVNGQEFAAALIELSYSHAAWFIGDIARAESHAQEAARRFKQFGNYNYAGRARELLGLLQAWQALEKGEKPSFDGLPPELKRGVAALVMGEDSEFLCSWFVRLRPSRAVGLLQFANRFSKRYEAPFNIQLPSVLNAEQNGWRWGNALYAGSLAEGNQILRQQIRILNERRLPLIAD